MRNISNLIERYLKEILASSEESIIEIQRSNLAHKFSCVPSQINYVIGTRFTLEKGYMVESKRGGGGYIRIQRISLLSLQMVQYHILQTVGQKMNEQAAIGLIGQLEEAQFLTSREGYLLKKAISNEALPLHSPLQLEVRAQLLKTMLLASLAK